MVNAEISNAEVTKEILENRSERGQKLILEVAINLNKNIRPKSVPYIINRVTPKMNLGQYLKEKVGSS